MQDHRSPMSARIRPATVADASELLDVKITLDHETPFMMLEPGERNRDIEALAKPLRERGELSNSGVLVAEEEGRLVGYVEATGGAFNRNRHRADVVMGVLQVASGRGVGSLLLEALDIWAERHGISRLELTVLSHIKPPIALYKRRAAWTERPRNRSVRVGSEYIDELAMVKLLDVEPAV